MRTEAEIRFMVTELQKVRSTAYDDLERSAIAEDDDGIRLFTKQSYACTLQIKALEWALGDEAGKVVLS